VVLDIIPSFYSVFILFFPLVSIFSFTPFVWKKNSAFGVMLPEEFKSNKQLAIMSRKYTLFAIVAGACLSLTCVVVQHNSVTIFCAVVYVILCLAMFVMNNRLVRNIIAVNDYENMQKPVFMQSVTEEFKIKTISIWWLAVLLIPVAISFYDAYKNKTDIFYIVPVVQLLLIAVDVVAFFLIRKTGQYVDKKTMSKDMKRNAFVRKQLSALVFCVSVMLSFYLTLMQLCNSGTLVADWIINVAPAVIVVIVTFFAILFCMRINKK